MPRKKNSGEKYASALKGKLISLALDLPEFRASLNDAAVEIQTGARPEATEATIEGYFERVLYAVLKDEGIAFAPEKEAVVDTRRHVSIGRTDRIEHGVVPHGSILTVCLVGSALVRSQEMSVRIAEGAGHTERRMRFRWRA